MTRRGHDVSTELPQSFEEILPRDIGPRTGFVRLGKMSHSHLARRLSRSFPRNSGPVASPRSANAVLSVQCSVGRVSTHTQVVGF